MERERKKEREIERARKVKIKRERKREGREREVNDLILKAMPKLQSKQRWSCVKRACIKNLLKKIFH